MSHSISAPHASGEIDLERREFLTCRLGGESYGIDILKVQEIREVNDVTRVPHVAPFVRGVINLRGAIVPIVERRLVGLIVSSVSDVLALSDEEILPAPDLGTRAIATAIEGIGVRRGTAEGEADTSILLLDVDHIMRRVREERQ
jgi:purine-binding chemotaxis protein CheW